MMRIGIRKVIHFNKPSKMKKTVLLVIVITLFASCAVSSTAYYQKSAIKQTNCSYKIR